ncbi:MAG: DNA polymerase [Candidatus Onthomonas sp.]
MTVMGVDIETYSSVDLARSGVRPYTEAADFTILLIAYQVEGQPTRLIDLTAGEAEPSLLPPMESPLPEGELETFLSLLTDPEVLKTAYNAAFERTCLARYFRRPMPPEQWQCTMVQAAALGLPGSLAQVGASLGLDQQKMTEGAELIRYFCKPTRAGVRHLPQDAPERWETFRRYCVRDVDVETDIRRRLSRWPRPREEQAAWALDQRINDRGVRLDAGLVQQAIAWDRRSSARLKEEAKALTGLDNPNSPAQLTRWLQSRGLTVDSLDKEALPDLLAAAPDETTRRVLRLRQALSKTSVKKYEAMERGLGADGRLHNLLQFYGAGRTGRWAGRLVQVHNLPRNELHDLAQARELVRAGEFDLAELAYGAPAELLSQLIRTAFVPSEGCRFLVCDYSAIEARVLAWLAGERWVLEVFRGDGLIYEATASMMFHVPLEDIRKGGPRSDLRPKGKVATLACGYQGGPHALIQMGALKSGIPEEELPGIVRRWRGANKAIVRYWYQVEEAAIQAVQGRPSVLAHGLRFQREGDWLFVTLPSRRRLAYYKPELHPEPQFDNKLGLTYLGASQSKGYTRLKTYGGKLVENITQAVARDCLRDAMAALEEAGYPVVFHVHDEVILDVPKGRGSLEEVRAIMSRPIPWAPGLPLDAAGFEAEFYQKD